MISTEFANVGGTDQLEGSRSIITSMLDAHAHGMDRITYFLMHVNDGNAAPLRQAVLRGEFPGDGFQWMQYVDRPRVADAITDQDWGRGMWSTDRRGASLMPMLKTTAYYNFVQAVECADFKHVFKPTPRSIAYVYVRDGTTICYVFQREPNPPATLALATSVPYVMQDIYGRSDPHHPERHLAGRRDPGSARPALRGRGARAARSGHRRRRAEAGRGRPDPADHRARRCRKRRAAAGAGVRCRHRLARRHHRRWHLAQAGTGDPADRRQRRTADPAHRHRRRPGHRQLHLHYPALRRRAAGLGAQAAAGGRRSPPGAAGRRADDADPGIPPSP